MPRSIPCASAIPRLAGYSKAPRYSKHCPGYTATISNRTLSGTGSTVFTYNRLSRRSTWRFSSSIADSGLGPSRPLRIFTSTKHRAFPSHATRSRSPRCLAFRHRRATITNPCRRRWKSAANSPCSPASKCPARCGKRWRRAAVCRIAASILSRTISPIIPTSSLNA